MCSVSYQLVCISAYGGKQLRSCSVDKNRSSLATSPSQERMMTSLFFHGGGGRACDWQKFETGGIFGVY